ADRQTIDAGGAILLEPALLHRAGIGFQRYLDVVSKSDLLSQTRQQRLVETAGHQTRCATTKEDRLDRPALHVIKLALEIFQQRGEIRLLGNLAAFVGIEIAIRTLAHAP